MKIAYYCQHIWGVGHLFRTLEICRAMAEHRVHLILGGPRVEIDVPENVTIFRLPAIMTDRDYNGLYTDETGETLDSVRNRRQKMLFEFFQNLAPDVFMVELYPFGRRAFRFELEPVLAAVRSGELPRCKVHSSLRDILVEKKDEAYEKWVVDRLNRYFDSLLVHADPDLVRLEETFDRVSDIRIPMIYTGFVSQHIDWRSDMRRSERRKNGIAEKDKWIVASAGGGKIGARLLFPLIDAIRMFDPKDRVRVSVFTGPFMDDAEYDRLAEKTEDGIRISRFTSNFLSLLFAADLSVSMGGYNTTMNILASGIPALVWPSPTDREQGLRAGKLARKGLLGVLTQKDLDPFQLAGRIKTSLTNRRSSRAAVDLNGASKTAHYVDHSSGRFVGKTGPNDTSFGP